MTDKQIIIDGVDVGWCPYYCSHDICKNTCHYFSTPCEWVDVQNCTYKQFIQAEQTVEECHKYQAELEDKLTAKEQECEELKEAQKNSRCAWKSFEGTFCPEAQEQLDQLKAENDTYKKMFEDEDVQLALNEVRTGERHIWFNKTEKLKQTLAEIKEIAEHCINQDICTTCDNSDKCHIEDEEIPTYDVCKLILQKISECEGSDELTK